MKARKFVAVIAAVMTMMSVGAVAASADFTAPAAQTVSAETGAYIIGGDDFRAAYSETGENTKSYVTFKELGSYELRYNFRLTSGLTKTYTALSPKMKGITAYIPMQDMLDKLHISAEDVSEIVIDGPSFDNVAKISFSLGSAAPAAAQAVPAAAPAAPEKVTATTTVSYNGDLISPSTDVQAPAQAEENPSTGVDDVAVPLAAAAVFAATALIAVSTRKKLK